MDIEGHRSGADQPPQEAEDAFECQTRFFTEPFF